MKHIIIALALLLTFGLHAQGEDQTDRTLSNEKKELLHLAKTLFPLTASIEFTVSTKDIMPSFEFIEDGKKYDDDYLKSLLEPLKKDSLNPHYLHNVGEFYRQTNQMKMARIYFARALNNIETFGKVKDNDSTDFYVMRGVLKVHLGDLSAINDFEKLTNMNNIDEEKLLFYLFALMAKEDFEKARSFVINLNNTNSKCNASPYVALLITELFLKIQQIEKLVVNKEIRDAYTNKSYNAIFDYTLFDKYASLCKGNVGIENTRIMADIIGIMSKGYINSKISDIGTFPNATIPSIKFNSDSHETQKLEDILKKLSELGNQHKLNKYALYKSYGFVYLMQRDFDQAIRYLNKAIEVFPSEKRAENFSPDGSFNQLSYIYLYKADTLNYKKTIQRKLANEPYQAKTDDELLSLALIHYHEGELDDAEALCNKVLAINPTNFDALRLVAHIEFLKGFRLKPLFQLDKAGKQIKSEGDMYFLLMQLAIYQIYKGDMISARKNLEKVQEIKGEGKCTLCDKLLNAYVVKN